MTNASRMLYVGMTNNLVRRVYEHKRGQGSKFTAKYHITWLAYSETYTYVNDAIRREKQLKGWRRAKKIALIESVNPTWRDLTLDWNN